MSFINADLIKLLSNDNSYYIELLIQVIVDDSIFCACVQVMNLMMHVRKMGECYGRHVLAGSRRTS